MARRRGVDTKIQVTRGFVTEFTPVSFPQEAAIDIDNCIIDTDGSVRRRPGLDLEKGFQLQQVNGAELSAAEISGSAFTTYLWEAVNGSGSLNIIVQQIGDRLQFYSQAGAVSANKLGEISLSAFAVDVVKLPQSNMEFTAGLGDLFVVNKFMEPVRINFDDINFNVTVIVMQVRDFDGVPDALALDERPTTLSKEHQYNLLNQGWTFENIRLFAGLLGFGAVIPDGQEALLGQVFPSNADIMTVGIVTNTSGVLVFDKDFIKDDFLGNTPAPKGHFVLAVFNKQRSSASGIPSIPDVVVNTRPEAIAFLQGRVFYTAPVNSLQISGIFYSQQLTNKGKAASCFQEADPTATEINDLIATDGGFLPTPGVGQIFRMQEMGNGIVCFASNGVWYLSGAEAGVAFTATSIRLEKIDPAGALGTSSVVSAGGQVFYWGVEGIMVVALDNIGAASVQNLSQTSIQSFYVGISAAARLVAKAVYIPEQRKVFWAYSDAAVAATPADATINRMLVLDLDVKGFYTYSIGTDNPNNYPQVVGLSRIAPLVTSVESNSVTTIAGVTVTTIALEAITSSIGVNAGQASTLKLATMAFSVPDAGFRFTFSTFHSRDFVDWTSQPLGSLPMSSFVEFAEFNMGATHTRGSPIYVHSFYSTVSKNLEVGGYYELPAL